MERVTNIVKMNKKTLQFNIDSIDIQICPRELFGGIIVQIFFFSLLVCFQQILLFFMFVNYVISIFRLLYKKRFCESITRICSVFLESSCDNGSNRTATIC